MPANSKHPDCDANTMVWLRARDVLAGEDAVKAGGERYLSKLESQTDDEYLAYKNRASFFNATARTADGYVGLIFRREPTVKCGARDGESGASPIEKSLAEFAADVDLLGNSLESYAKNVVTEVIGVGRVGTLVDWEDEGEKRAYAVMYRAEQILNWRMDRVNGRNVVALVVLHEEVAATPDNGEEDSFESPTIEQIRVLKLVDAESAAVPRPAGERQPHYVVELWREENVQPGVKRARRGKRKWVMVESRTPLRLGKPLPLIPFVFHGAQHSLPQIEKLPLADIIAINLDHYRLDANYKHGLHFTALPTVWLSGFKKDPTLKIGSSAAWVTETLGAAAGFLEFKGQGLETFERAMDRDEKLMALLGTRMLEAQKRVGETADAIEMRQSGENSVLSTLAMSVSNSLTQVLQWVVWWNSTDALPEDIGEDRVLIQLNTDFSNKGMSSDELLAVVSAWQAGAISRETMFDLFRRGEVMPAGRSDDEEKKLAAASPAPASAGDLKNAGSVKGAK